MEKIAFFTNVRVRRRFFGRHPHNIRQREMHHALQTGRLWLRTIYRSIVSKQALLYSKKRRRAEGLLFREFESGGDNTNLQRLRVVS